MDMLPVSYMPGDPLLIDNIVWELKSQGIFDTFRKECIADVDTKPAYQNLRQRVEGSVSSFLRKQTWRPDLNKNQLREQLRKNIYESGYLEKGVERIVDQVVNPKMNTVFLPKVTDVVYQYLGLAKPEVKSEREKEEELKSKSEELLPKELEAVSPESRHDDRNDDSNLSLESMKLDEDESPPFEPLDEDNSIDSHMSGISGLQSHDSNSSPKALQIDETQCSASKHSSDGAPPMEVDDPVAADATPSQDKELVATMEALGVSGKNGGQDQEKDKAKGVEKPPGEGKQRSRSESKGDRGDRKHERSKDKHRDREREHQHDRDKSRGEKDKDRRRESGAKHGDRKKDDRRERDKEREKCATSASGGNGRGRDKERAKSGCKPRDDKSRSHCEGARDRKSSSSRGAGGRERDKRDKYKERERKDDHYSSKHKGERRSTDRDSNDGSGLKSSSSSYCESNSSSQHSHKETSTNSNSNDSGQSGRSEKNERQRAGKEARCASAGARSAMAAVLESQVALAAEVEIRPRTPPSMSVSAASWDALEAQLNSNVNYDMINYDSDHEAGEKAVATPEDVRGSQDERDAGAPGARQSPTLQYFSRASIETDENSLEAATRCLAELERQIATAQSRLVPRNVTPNSKLIAKRRADAVVESPVKRTRNNNIVGSLALVNGGQHFHMPLSPAESDSDKSTDRKADEAPPSTQSKRKASVNVTQRYSSDDLYKPRPVIKRSTNRRRGNVDNVDSM